MGKVITIQPSKQHYTQEIERDMESFTHRPHLQVAKRVYDGYIRSSSKKHLGQSFGMADQIHKDHSYTTSATMNTTNQDQGLKWYQAPNPVGQKVQALSLNPQIFCISCKKR